MTPFLRWIKRLCVAGVLMAVLLVVSTTLAVQPIDQSFRALMANAEIVQITDRTGKPLTISYQNRWNFDDHAALYTVPPLLVHAFLLSEDKRFYDHKGVDWRARGSALWLNLRHGRALRGASTITEQVVRMLHPRPRNLWSKWVEGFESLWLERRFSKQEILEFYLNQLPYAANRRGVLQAARYYFDRDLSTLTFREMLALVILARAPSAYDLYRKPEAMQLPLKRLADALAVAGKITPETAADIAEGSVQLNAPEAPVEAAHFARFVRRQFHSHGDTLRSTLNAGLQRNVQGILEERVRYLASKSVRNAAALVVDHRTGEVLAWVIAGAGKKAESANAIDAVTVPRQPGSALKPFLYVLALERGWTAATLIDDSPLSEAVGRGLHRFKNYSNRYYGPVTLREALANSLNIPALRTIQFVGAARYLEMLHALGFASLNRPIEIYDEGLALGNGEVTLFEMVQAYATLANHGVTRPLHVLVEAETAPPARSIFSAEVSSLIGHILSDTYARRLEFGTSSVLNLPVQTAVKTGTSTDYRDAWAMGYDAHYTVGIWMGNLDQQPTDGITGAIGPALAMRSIFTELTRYQRTEPLYLSPRLERHKICIDASPKSDCATRTEYFVPGSFSDSPVSASTETMPNMVTPTEGLELAYDPRIPPERQKFMFRLSGTRVGDVTQWIVDGAAVPSDDMPNYLWNVTRGKHKAQARVRRNGKIVFESDETSFIVK